MASLALRVEGLSKHYRIGAGSGGPGNGLTGSGYRTLRGTLTDALAAPIRSLARRADRGGGGTAREGTIWALRDVTLEVGSGEVLGIIGRNGAGKSTLLKVLSRITPPTAGFAEIHGRIGSLLEVGTGFHPELTGRENVYLNGAILGMRRTEITRKFDEIVAFAEVEQFLDTPVKHYSTGMYMRLAFAVAAHLEPEILLVDEVLAVGDARFQKKCLTKMQDVGKEGRTVLFVSHNMQAVTRICPRTILLDRGVLVHDGPSYQTVSIYLDTGYGTPAERVWPDAATAPGGEVVRLRAVRVRAQDGRVTNALDIRQPIGVEMEFDVLRGGYVLMPYYDFLTEGGLIAFSSADFDPVWRQKGRPVGRYVSTAWIPGNLLAEGRLFVAAGLRTLSPVVSQFFERDVVAFQAIDTTEGDSTRGDWTGVWEGVVRPLLPWTTRLVPDGETAARGVE